MRKRTVRKEEGRCVCVCVRVGRKSKGGRIDIEKSHSARCEKKEGEGIRIFMSNV